ncbi:MAG: zinc-ribbon domain-containing protein [Methanobrevibacter sp.]|nr:zinc-ribbon domain-containing protein [Methanobrevibacter sp.]
MANYCSNCGSKLEEGSDFCTNCGTPIKHGNKQKSNHPSDSVLDNNSNLNNKLGGMDMGNMIKCIVPIVIIVMQIVTKLSTTFLSLRIIILFSSVIKVLEIRSNRRILTYIQI